VSVEVPAPSARDEDAWIGAIAKRFPPGPRVRVGIGHDAAVVDFDGAGVVLKIDTVVDGVDFHLAACGPKAAARKALAVTVSDLAAMGALPRACVVSAVLPRSVDFAAFDALAAGFEEAAREAECDVVGGDTSVADGPLVLTVAAVGEPGPHGYVTRGGARPGMHLSVTGPLGGSILGRHLTFSPRLREAQVLLAHGVPSAMMDLSDGLSADLPRLCAMSGVGAVVDADRVPIHDDARRMPGDHTPLFHALHDGEDFELLVAHPPLSAAVLAELARQGVVLHPIGEFNDDDGRVILRQGDRTAPLVRRGYDHLRGPAPA
jgi:thiamine-monophosphate kinase